MTRQSLERKFHRFNELGDLPIWVACTTSKVPINPHTGKAGSASDPATWGTRSEAEAAVAKYGLAGIGIALTTLPDGRRLCGLDTDGCYSATGDGRAAWVDDVYALLDGCYNELSPSCTGRHHLFLIDPATLPDDAGERSDYSNRKKKPERNGFELYLTGGRYFTVTGHDVGGELMVLGPATIVQLTNLLDIAFPLPEEVPPPKPNGHQVGHKHASDHDKALEILDHLSNAGSYASYIPWFKIVGSAHSATDGSEAGLRAVETWTEKGGYKSGHCGELWGYFRRTPPRKLDIRHLINEARAHGYEPYPPHSGPDRRPTDIEAAKSIVWTRPEPLLSDSRRYPYPVEALPDLIRQAVEEVQLFVQCSIEMVAASALSALSIAAQPLIDIRRSSGLQGPTGLYYLTIAESGERKTTSDKFFMQAIYEYERKKREEGKGAEAEYAASLAVWEAMRKAADVKLDVAAKDKKPLEACQAELSALEKGKPTPPRIPRIIYADATQEKLLRCLATGWPSAAIVSSEAGAVFGAHAMGRDSVMRTLGSLNVLWDGGVLPVDRVGGGSFTVRGARLSISLQVQPAVLRDFMEGNKGLARGSGFLARFLLSAPESRQGTRMFQEPPPKWPALDAFNARIAELLATKATINDDGSLSPVVLDLSREAKAAWVEYHDRIEKEIGPIGDLADVRDVAAKAADNIARLAALFHFLDARNGYGSIGPDAVRSAALVVIWHLYESKRFLGSFSLSAEAARAAALDGWLRDYCRRESVTIVSIRTVQQFSPVRARKALDEALATLAEHGRAKIIAEGKKRLIAINPALLEAIP
jgi:putative DNA primase/helicase